MTRLLHFTLLGLGWLALRWGFTPAPRLEVVVPPGGSPEQAIEEALLLAEAERLGWIESDLVIQRHLTKVYGEATQQPDADPRVLWAGARALGLHRTDRVVRSRLLDRAERALVSGPDPDEPTLEAHLAAHAERFANPPLYTLELRYRSKVRHGRALDAVIATTTQALVDGMEVETDPLPLAVRSPLTAPLPRLRSRLDHRVVEAVIEAPVGVWSPALRTGDGAWFVKVVERREVPPRLDEVRAAVRADWHATQAPRRRARRLKRLGQQWRIDVVTP